MANKIGLEGAPAAVRVTTSPGPARVKELRARTGELLRRAILTLAVIPCPDWKYRRPLGSSLPAPIRAIEESYGYATARAVRFKPTPADVDRVLDVQGWLTEHAREPGGERDVKCIVAHAFGIPRWRLAQRFGCSDKTVERWHAGAVAAIAYRHAAEIEAMP